MIEEFYIPETVSEALALKKQCGDEGLYIAGGAEVNNLFFPLKPNCLISLQALGLNQIKTETNRLILEANCTLQQIIEDNNVPKPLKKACQKLVNRNIRNVATIGGHIATNKSCSDLLPTLVVMGAQLKLAKESGEEIILLEDYIAEEKKDLIIEIVLPTGCKGRQTFLTNYTRSANDISILTAAISYCKPDDKLKGIKIAVGGVAKHVVRLNHVEDKLNEKQLIDRDEIEKMVQEAVNPITDIRGSAEFKKYEVSVMVGELFYK